MRRALTTGLALYLGLGRVLSSPVQVQAPFELGKENTPEAEDTPISTSKLQLQLSSSLPHRGVVVVDRTPERSRESRLIGPL